MAHTTPFHLALSVSCTLPCHLTIRRQTFGSWRRGFALQVALAITDVLWIHGLMSIGSLTGQLHSISLRIGRQAFWAGVDGHANDNTTLWVKDNAWSHVVWQCFPSTGVQTLVDGHVASTSNYIPNIVSRGVLCFGGVIDLQTSNQVLHLDGDVGQLLFRVGSTVEQYVDGYYLPHGFTNLTVPSGCAANEHST